jgi:hypothetical protein
MLKSRFSHLDASCEMVNLKDAFPFTSRVGFSSEGNSTPSKVVRSGA